MSDASKTEELYRKLKLQLEETKTWPLEYLYKFIVKTDTSKIKKVEAFFNDKGAVINTTKSKNGKYTSISINVVMKNPDEVIKKYIEVTSTIEGVISL